MIDTDSSEVHTLLAEGNSRLKSFRFSQSLLALLEETAKAKGIKPSELLRLILAEGLVSLQQDVEESRELRAVIELASVQKRVNEQLQRLEVVHRGLNQLFEAS